MTLRNVIPIILSGLLISLIILIMAIRIEHQKMWGSSFINLDFLFILTYIMWIIEFLRIFLLSLLPWSLFLCSPDKVFPKVDVLIVR